MNSIEINGVTLNVGHYVLVEDEELVVVDIVGRWVKLSNRKSISRADAIEAREAFLEYLGGDDEEADEAEGEEEAESRDIIDPKYRELYARTKSVSGNRSYDKGDELAELLRGFSPDQVIELAGLESNVWSHLNPGQRSMNARNNIRNQVKKGTMTMAFIRSNAASIRKSMA